MVLTPETATALGMGFGGMLGGYFSARRGAKHGSVTLNGAAMDLKGMATDVKKLGLDMREVQTRLAMCPLHERRALSRE